MDLLGILLLRLLDAHFDFAFGERTLDPDYFTLKLTDASRCSEKCSRFDGCERDAVDTLFKVVVTAFRRCSYSLRSDSFAPRVSRFCLVFTHILEYLDCYIESTPRYASCTLDRLSLLKAASRVFSAQLACCDVRACDLTPCGEEAVKWWA